MLERKKESLYSTHRLGYANVLEVKNMYDNLVPLQQGNFDCEIASVPVAMVVFYTSWCGLCRTLFPTICEIAEEMKDSICVYVIDTEKNAELSARYRIRNVPAIYFFKNGRPVEFTVGVQSKDDLLQMARNISLY